MTTPTDSLYQEARERAKKVNVAPDLMALAIRGERKDRPYVVEFESKVAGPFFRVTQEGPSKVLYINMDHPFFLDTYMAPGSTVRYRDALEVFLWTLGLCELEAPDERTRLFYLQERQGWSERLRVAVPILAELMDHAGAREMEALEAEEAERELDRAEDEAELERHDREDLGDGTS